MCLLLNSQISENQQCFDNVETMTSCMFPSKSRETFYIQIVLTHLSQKACLQYFPAQNIKHAYYTNGCWACNMFYSPDKVGGCVLVDQLATYALASGA